MGIIFDLRPHEIINKEKSRWKIITMMTFMVVLLVFGGIWYYLLYFENQQLSAKLINYEAEGVQIKNEFDVHEDTKSYILIYEKKIDNIERIKEERVIWSEIISELVEVLPAGLTIENYRAYSNNNIDIKGSSSSVKDIAVLKQRLKDNKKYLNVALNIVDKRSRTGDSIYYFEMNAKTAEAKK